MTTLSAGNSQTQTLPAYDTLTLITSSEGVGSVVRLGDTPGQEVQGITAVAAGSPVIIGPYAISTRHNIICRAGSISYEIARADFATESEVGAIPWDDVTDKPDFGTAAEANLADLVQVGGQAPASALVLGTTNEQGVTVKVNGNDMLVIDAIGNVGIGVSNPEAPLAVAGAITVAAGSVATEWNPTSGTALSLGTVSNHPVNITSNGALVLTLDTNGQLTAGASYVPNGAKSLAPKDYVDTAVALAIPLTQKAAANGVATLDASGKVPTAQVNVSGLNYLGTWDAATNVPALTNGTGNAGDFYKVAVAGSHNFGAGAIVFAVGDWVIYESAIWQQIGAHEAVASVNGRTGIITLTSADVGLPNVDNTADADKPVSTAQQTAIAAKANQTDFATHVANVAVGAHVPTGGTQGQILTRGAGTASEWGDLPAANIGAPQTQTSGTITLTATDAQVQLVDASGGATTITLPDATGGAPAGKVFTVKKMDNSSNSVTINAGTATIDGAAEQAIATALSTLTFVFDGTNYFLIYG